MQKTKTIGFMKGRSDFERYRIERDGKTIRVVKIGECEPLNSHYPVDPRIICYNDRVILETDNPLEVLKYLIRRAPNKKVKLLLEKILNRELKGKVEIWNNVPIQLLFELNVDELFS